MTEKRTRAASRVRWRASWLRLNVELIEKRVTFGEAGRLHGRRAAHAGIGEGMDAIFTPPARHSSRTLHTPEPRR